MVEGNMVVGTETHSIINTIEILTDTSIVLMIEDINQLLVIFTEILIKENINIQELEEVIATIPMMKIMNMMKVLHLHHILFQRDFHADSPILIIITILVK